MWRSMDVGKKPKEANPMDEKEYAKQQKKTNGTRHSGKALAKLTANYFTHD